MALVHTDAAAIFGAPLINAAEDKIQYVKLRPSQPYDSKQPVSFKIPGNMSQYISLHDSYIYLECHLEETDAYGKPVSPSENKNKRKVRSVEEESGRKQQEEEEEDKNKHPRTHLPNQPMPNGGRHASPERDMQGDEPGSNIGTSHPPLDTIFDVNEDIAQLFKNADEAYTQAHRAREYFWSLDETDPDYDRAKLTAQGQSDMAVMAMKQYMEARYRHKAIDGVTGAIVPIDNVLHSMWSGIDIYMNGELVSTTNQKYMYKAYIETVLNNSFSTKDHQLKSSGFYGDNGNRDDFFNITFNKGMEKRYLRFQQHDRVELMGFPLSDIMGIRGAIVNGVEIEVILTPNIDSLRLQCFGDKKYGRLVLDDIVFYVCKRSFAKEVVLAHAEIMEKSEATYPFKKTEVRTYNGTKGHTQVIIENPYESKIPTRFILGMVDAESYIGDWQKSPLNFQHFDISRAAFFIDDESIAKPPYLLNPKKGRFIEPLMELYNILGKAGEDQDIGISTENYLDGLFLIPFDVTPTAAANMEYLAKKEGGNCRIELQFRNPLKKNIIIITYAIFPAELRIDEARNCRVIPV